MKIAFFHIHGLIKSSGLEIGRDSDNGGQTRYVYELGEALAQHEDVEKLIIFTRLIKDPKVSEEYSKRVEVISPFFEIHRIPFGGDDYMPKEQLWPHLKEMVENTLLHIQSYNLIFDWMHSHYGDGGYVCSQLALTLAVPFAHTGHSLGIPKKEKMLAGGMSEEEAEDLFNFKARISAENRLLDTAEFVITSTYQEITDWEKYDNFDNATIQVLSPGTDTTKFLPYYLDQIEGADPDPEHIERKYWVGQSIEKFLSQPSKAVILALCRPDRRKNLTTLIKTYGESKELQSLANLVIFAGIRKDINKMPDAEKAVLTEILLLMDKYDLYGKLAIPKKHDIENEVAYIYAYSASKRGVFVNLSLHENFGLTTIEAAATGLPVVATKNGGPSEILPKCKNGILVTPTDQSEVKSALMTLLTDDDKWRKYSNNGIKNVRNYYSWQAHSDQYVGWVQEILAPKELKSHSDYHISANFYKNIIDAERLLITDIDGTLIAGDNDFPGIEIIKSYIEDQANKTALAFATGRNLTLVRDIIKKTNVQPHIIVSSVGSYIHYGHDNDQFDKDWHEYIDFKWQREKVREKLKNVSWLKEQEPETQNDYKLSYYVKAQQYDDVELRETLGRTYYHINIIASADRFLDILPMRASKGNAIKYLSQKWKFPLHQIIACGDTGNDADMFRRPVKGVIVGNRSNELADLPHTKYIYHAEAAAAEGIYEGLQHYGFV